MLTFESALTVDENIIFTHPQTVYQVRLHRFRNLGLVCKNWSNLARNVFWSDIEVSSLKLQRLAKAITSPEARPSCIRRFTILTPRHTNASIRKAIKSFPICLPTILRHLPGMLQAFYVSRQSAMVREPLWHVIQKTVQEGHDWTTGVTSLVITNTPPRMAMSTLSLHFINITQLRVSLEHYHGGDTYHSSFDHLCLTSLTVDVVFSGLGEAEHFTSAAKGLGHALRAACSNLKSSCIKMWSWCSEDERLYVDVFKHLHPLGSATVSNLSLEVACDKDNHPDPMPMRAIEREGALAKFPALQTLVLHEFGITSTCFAQMGNFELQHLRVVVMENMSLDGSETMGEMIQCLALPQLAKVDSIEVSFGELADFGLPAEDQEWRGTREAWAHFERACADREIQCRIVHPQS